MNVRFTADELELLDLLRRSAGGDVSRSSYIRSLLWDRRRAAEDQRIAEAYDAAAPADSGLAEANAVVAGDALHGF